MVTNKRIYNNFLVTGQFIIRSHYTALLCIFEFTSQKAKSKKSVFITFRTRSTQFYCNNVDIIVQRTRSLSGEVAGPIIILYHILILFIFSVFNFSKFICEMPASASSLHDLIYALFVLDIIVHGQHIIEQQTTSTLGGQQECQDLSGLFLPKYFA